MDPGPRGTGSKTLDEASWRRAEIGGPRDRSKIQAESSVDMGKGNNEWSPGWVDSGPVFPKVKCRPLHS